MEKLKLEINRHISSKNNMWAALIVSTSGTLAVMFNMDSLIKIIFFILGILLSIFFLAVYKAKSRYIDYLIDKTGE